MRANEAAIAWWARRQAFVRLLVWGTLVLAAAVAATPATLTRARQAVPPRMERLNPAPTPSGAEAAYPLNHVLDGESTTTGTPPANFDFEAASTSTGTPPANANLSAAASDAGTPPANHTFESTPDFTGWTVSGTVSIQTDVPHGRYAKLGASGSITSSAFTVDSAAQAFVFDVGYLTTAGYAWVKVYALTGMDYSTSTLLADLSCSACNAWDVASVNAVPYRGQSVKLKFERSFGEVGLDLVRAQVLFPNWEPAGDVKRRSEMDGNQYADLGSGGTLTSSAFTVAGDAQTITVRVKGLTATTDQYTVKLLSGAGYTTVTQVATGTATDDAWQTVRISAASWLGQSVKLQVLRAGALGRLGVDDGGLMLIDLPSWTVTDDTTKVTGGPSGAYARTNGRLTSSAFTLATDVQQLRVAYKGDAAGSSFYLELLRGADFSQVVDLAGNVVGDTTQWQTLKVGVSLYAGETVQLRLRRSFGWMLFDSAGLGERLLPGWTLPTAQPLVVGEDGRGSFVTSSAATGANRSVSLRSALIQSGVIDRPNLVDARYFAVSYDIGYSTGELVRVTWYNSATGQSWVVHLDAADTPTGYRTRYFALRDFMGQTGYFVVQLQGAGGQAKLYSLADNIARQQLAEPFSQTVGLRVDTSTGAFAFAERDLATATPLPLVLSRYYNAHSDRLGPLGSRWSHTYETRIEVSTAGDAGVVFGDGREAFFDWNSGTQTFTAGDARVKDTLVKNADGTYTFTTTSNLTFRFTAAGVLSSISDLNNNAIALAYDGAGRLVTATAPGGAALTFAYNAQGRLATVTDPAGAVMTYTYDGAGDLVAARDPVNQTRSYAYSRHRLTSVVDKNGQVLVTNTLDSVHRVTQQTDAQNKTLTIAYDTPAKGATRVTDPAGGQATYYFDTHHRTTDKQDPLGRVITNIYDTNGNLQKVVDPALNQWQFTYDSAGNPTTATDPLNQALQFTYNPKHLPTTISDARGNVTTLMYDAAGNLIQKRDPLNNVWTYTYDARGNVLTETNPLNQTTTYTYDLPNNRTSMTNPLGKTWTYTYDAAGRLLTETDPLGNTTTYAYDLAGRLISQRNALNQNTTYLYNAVGSLLWVEDPLGNRTQYAYNNLGLNTTKTDPAGKVTTYAYDANRNVVSATDPLNRTTTYTYDASNRLTTITDPAGGVTTFTYDTAGRLASERDPLNRTTSYTYNSAGRVTGVTLPNGATTTYAYDADGNLTSETNAQNRTTTYTYDAVGRRTRVTDALGHQTNLTYDAAGRMTAVTNALSQTTTYTYDAAGRLTGITNPLNQTTSYTYDSADRRTGIIDALGRTTNFGYDAAGRPTTVTTAAGTTTTTYDAAGRVTRVTRPSGAQTNYTYDPRGLLLSETNPLNQVTSYVYDNAGQQTSVTDPRMAVTTYQYDAAGRQTRITDALGGSVQFAYDLAGQLTSVTNARGKVTTFTYDSLGNVLTERDPLTRTTTHVYDNLGRRTQTTDPRGVVITYAYDALDRPTSTTYPGGSVTTAYDALGRRTSMTDATGTSSWTYDAAGQMTGATTPQGTVNYTYNAAGQRASMTLLTNRTVSYAYDTAGRLASLTDWQGRVTSFGYDADGRRTSVTQPTGVVTTNTYDAAGRLTNVAHVKAGMTLRSFAYAYDAAGNRVSATSGGVTESYTLDSLGRLASVSYGGTVESYTYDANGNRLTKTAGGTTTTYAYDDADQLLSEGSVSYSHDAAGNVTARGSDTFSWDWRNRLSSATVGSTSTTYTYDGDDVRVRKTVGTTTTTYLWDRQSGLPLLVDDGSRSYLHAGVVQAEIDPMNAATYHLSDALGSVRGLTDQAGAVTGSADYDVFGAVRASSGAGSVFGFAGEQRDAETDFTFLRARYYSPGSGRFLSVDSVQPGGPGTQGYNLYAYVANNPTTWADPSGHNATMVGNFKQVLALPPVVAGILACIMRVPGCAPIAVRAKVAESSSAYHSHAIGAGTLFVLAVICYLTEYCRPRALEIEKVIIGDPCEVFDACERARTADQWLFDARQMTFPFAVPLVIAGVSILVQKLPKCELGGVWRPENESMSPRARAYQFQITGVPPPFVYRLRNVKFDGCINGVLLEAKGCGLAPFLNDPRKREEIRDQMRRQRRAARGAPIVWHVAEAEAAIVIADIAERNGLSAAIRVVHTPAWLIPCD
jgi:RHS repeat-associated protein